MAEVRGRRQHVAVHGGGRRSRCSRVRRGGHGPEAVFPHFGGDRLDPGDPGLVAVRPEHLHVAAPARGRASWAPCERRCCSGRSRSTRSRSVTTRRCACKPRPRDDGARATGLVSRSNRRRGRWCNERRARLEPDRRERPDGGNSSSEANVGRAGSSTAYRTTDEPARSREQQRSQRESAEPAGTRPGEPEHRDDAAGSRRARSFVFTLLPDDPRNPRRPW